MCYFRWTMFGMSFGELVLAIVVAVVVIGPRDLPKVLRKLGQYAGKLRRMASELRHQSGIDEILRSDGIGENINEIRKLARGELDKITEAASVDRGALAAATHLSDGSESPDATDGAHDGHGDPHHADPYHADPYHMPGPHHDVDVTLLREREYPREGADSYGALPDTAFLYTESFATSVHGEDPLYMTGDPHGVVPPRPPPPPGHDPIPPRATENGDAHAEASPETTSAEPTTPEAAAEPPGEPEDAAPESPVPEMAPVAEARMSAPSPTSPSTPTQER